MVRVLVELLDLVQAGRVDPLAVTDCVLPFENALDAVAEPTSKPVFVREQIPRP